MNWRNLNNLTKEQKGFVFITSVLILSVLLIVGSYLVAFTSAEYKIAQSQKVATKNYYLAEAGIREMIWQIKHTTSTREAFLGGTLTSINDINRTNIFNDSNAAYQIKAVSTAPAEADITATSTYQIGNHQSQRVIKVYVAKATGSSSEWPMGYFSGGKGSNQNGNIKFNGSGTIATFNGGREHANQDVIIKGGEVVVNNGAITASNNLLIKSGGSLTLNNSYQSSPTTTVDMPQIDFDEWKNRATTIYTENQFKNLPDGTTLEGIIYVMGDAKITGKNLTINGVLLADDDIEITLAGQNLTVNNHPLYGSGILGKDDVEITSNGGTISLDGLIYSAKHLIITSAGTNFTVNGSLVGWDAEITASGVTITINYTPDYFLPVIDPYYNQHSPLIQISHWEEEY